MAKTARCAWLAICLQIWLADSIVADQQEVFLSWIDGPSALFQTISQDGSLQTTKTGSDRLALRSATYGLLLDSRQLDIPLLTLDAPVGDAATPVNPALSRTAWKKSRLQLTGVINGRKRTACFSKLKELSDIPRAKAFTYPVRIIESGNYFNHVAIYGISWAGDDGLNLGGGHVELRAWGDACLVEFHLKSGTDIRDAQLFWEVPDLEFVDRQQLEKVAAGAPTVLRVGFRREGKQLVPWQGQDLGIGVRCSESKHTEILNPTSGAWEIIIDKLSRIRSEGGNNYPAVQDRVTEVPFTITNTTGRPIDTKVRFIHPPHSITGFVPMLFDQDGRPTGIPVQTSKNWHKSKQLTLPYQGTWIHGSARIEVPAKSSRQLTYVIVHNRWQGVPATSGGQLSLVGWGHNGFWTQMALGSWGEQLCIQPGRLQRRCFVTDLRPMLARDRDGKKWAWTSNVGGCDTILLIDKRGKYLPWGGVATDYVASGPNLTHVRVRERSSNESIFLQTDTYLPRSDDIVRAFMSIRLFVKKGVAFERLALFQLGTDYYNANTSSAVSYGSGASNLGSERPETGKSTYVMDRVKLEGDQPWVSLTGNTPGPSSRLSEGTRGLIIRKFKAVLNGKNIDAPWLAAYRDRNGNLLAELVAPSEVTRLRSGDSLEMLLELAVFPLQADDYYGTSRELQQQLKLHADTWHMTAWEAHGNDARLQVDDEPASTRWPLSVSVSGREEIDFRISGGAGLIPVQLTGMSSPSEWQVVELIDGKSIPLGSRHPEELKPQVDYDRHAKSWTATLSLRPPSNTESEAVREFRWIGHQP